MVDLRNGSDNNSYSKKNKDINLFYLDEEQLDDWLKRFAYSIDSYWQSFAKELDFNEDEIQAIVGAFGDEPVKCQAHHMVMVWKEKYIYGNTLGALKLACWEMRRHDLLTALGEKL